MRIRRMVMAYQEKNGIKGLVVVLALMLLFVLYQFVISPLLKQEKEEEPTDTVDEVVDLDALGEKLYSQMTLSIGEEFGITDADKEHLTTKLSIYKMSDPLKITLGIKNVGEEYITYDGGYSLREAIENMDGNFYYSGEYITATAIENSIDNLFGPTPIKHQTITLRDNKYVYDDYKDIYEIWILRKTPEYTEEKITYNEVVANEEEILVYEYVAYTDYKDLDNITTRTVNSKNIGVVITEENVQDYLSYMDKYRYTFSKNEDGNYYFVSIEYMYE